VIVEQETERLKWTSLLQNIGISNISFMNQEEALQHLKQYNMASNWKSHYSIIIVDMDFAIIGDSSATTSYMVLEKLQNMDSRIKGVPTLCVVDSRMKKSKRRFSEVTQSEYTSSTTSPFQGTRDSDPTPKKENIMEAPVADSAVSIDNVLEERNNALHACIAKPFKNSRLLSTLHGLFFPNEKTPPTPRKQRISSVSSSISTLIRQESQHQVAQATDHLSIYNADHQSAGSESELLNFASIKTLIVDDNPVNLKVLSRMLTQIGIASITANNGREACDIIAQEQHLRPFDLVFMDIWMPEMNGLEATEKIRKELSTSAVQPYIIALTACVMAGDREKCFEAGMNGYVSKPIRKEELEASIHTFTQTVASVWDQGQSAPEKNTLSSEPNTKSATIGLLPRS
jgi:CheY-like chemotaxis protein